MIDIDILIKHGGRVEKIKLPDCPLLVCEAFIGGCSLGKHMHIDDAWAAIEEELNNRYNTLEAETNDENNFEIMVDKTYKV